MPSAARTPIDLLYQRPGFLLRRAHQLSVGIFEDECRALELTPAQYGALTVLSHAHGIDQSSVSRALGFDRVTTMHVVRGLERRGYVKRVPSPTHGRKLELSLTDEGRQVLAGARPPAERAYRRLMAPLDAAETKELNRLLHKLCAGLEHEARSPIQPPER